MVDQDGSGDISKRELHAVLAKAGFHASERVKLAVWRASDANSDGSVSWEEFRRLGKTFRALGMTAEPTGVQRSAQASLGKGRARS